MRVLKQIIEWRGVSRTIRVDNCPEYVSGTLMEWAENSGFTLVCTPPGKPQQNACVERYDRTIRPEGLWSYNNECPNMGNGGMTPAQKLRMAA